MRTTGPFSQYNRHIAMRRPDPDRPDLPLSKSLLGGFGAIEAIFLRTMVEFADADRTTK